jgi:hypothetical protein
MHGEGGSLACGGGGIEIQARCCGGHSRATESGAKGLHDCEDPLDRPTRMATW